MERYGKHNEEIFHNLYTVWGQVEVYGWSDCCVYEWRVTGHDGVIVKDTGLDGSSYCQGRQYGMTEVALSDALNFARGDQ